MNEIINISGIMYKVRFKIDS